MLLGSSPDFNFRKGGEKNMNFVANLLTAFADTTVSTNCFLYFFKGNVPAELLKK
ncbi:hypothetical protein D3C80_2031010 [compost metagenome]